jgi:HEPN domain-containing protein
MNESRDLARVLLEKAKGDCYVVGRLKDDANAPAWTVGFHAQQSVEKAMKAVLCVHGAGYPRTHNIAMLLGLLRGKGVPDPPEADGLTELTPFVGGFRYEDEGREDRNLPLDRAWAATCAERTIRWAESILSG